MDKRNLDATKLALLKAAEKLMTECDDPSEVTSRTVSGEAGVNLAMINYCFGSREAMLFEVFKKLQSEALNRNSVFGKIIKDDISPKEKLILLHYESMKIMLQNYKYVKAVTKFALLDRSISEERGSFSFIKEHFGGRKTESECLFTAYQISSIHELAVLRHEEIKKVCGIDLTNDETLKKFVTDNINMFLDSEEE